MTLHRAIRLGSFLKMFKIEIIFLGAAIIITVVMGFIFIPIIRKSMKD